MIRLAISAGPDICIRRHHCFAAIAATDSANLAPCFAIMDKQWSAAVALKFSNKISLKSRFTVFTL
jgi:hypothetical protein